MAVRIYPNSSKLRHKAPVMNWGREKHSDRKGLCLDLDVDTGSNRQDFELVYRVGCGIQDIEKANVSSHFELLTGLFVDVG